MSDKDFGSGSHLTVDHLVVNTDASIPGVSLAATPVTGANPSAPSTTTSTGTVMAGLAVAFTPSQFTKALVMISGVVNQATAVVGVTIDPRYGTGTAPTNGAAVTGTASPMGAIGVRPAAAGATPNAPFALFYLVTGLVVGTAYWFDLGYKTANASDAAGLGQLSFAFVECQ